MLSSAVTWATDFSGLFTEVDPAVVVIHTDTRHTRAAGEQLQTYTSKSLGTGVTISKDGLILTAAHVVNNADKLQVKFIDGGEYSATVLFSVASADIALIRVDSSREDFATVAVGDSDKVRTGEEVFVIGTPYGLEHTLTVGHLSGRRTTQDIGNHNIEFLQTDASINQGNSGGPLFNKDGDLIGIVSHIQTKSGGNEGLGFAASINTVKEQLLEKPSIWFGTEHIFLEPDVSAALNVPQNGGLLITKVTNKSFAQQIGLKGGAVEATILDQEMVIGGDIILSIDQFPIEADKEKLHELLQYTQSLKAGDRVVFKVLRMGEIIELSAVKPEPAFSINFD